MLHRVMNWVWIRIIKPQAERAARVGPGIVDAAFEEGFIWGKLQRDRQLVLACVQAVTEESMIKRRFEEQRQAMAQAFRALCREELKEMFLRPLLTYMNILDQYFGVEEPEDIPGLPRGCEKSTLSALTVFKVTDIAEALSSPVAVELI